MSRSAEDSGFRWSKASRCEECGELRDDCICVDADEYEEPWDEDEDVDDDDRG